MKTYQVFNVYPDTTANITAKAIFIDGQYQGVKLVTKLPRGQYYSILNDAMEEAERRFL